jgi:hypothetical protein
VNGYDGIFIIPRDAFDIDYDTSVPEELVDEYNTVNDLSFTFEEIMANQVDYTMERKSVFRNDASMFHQVSSPFSLLHSTANTYTQFTV